MKQNDLFDLELFIAKILRIGVIISGTFIFIGWFGQFKLDEKSIERFQTYKHVTLLQNLQELERTQSWGLLTMYLGLLVLIVIPLIRVMLTGLIFLKQKDYKLAALVGVVITGLFISISLGFEI